MKKIWKKHKVRVNFPKDIPNGLASGILLLMAIAALVFLLLILFLFSPRVEANPLITSEGNTWTYSDFEDTTKWTQSSGVTNTLETSIILDGTKALKLVVYNQSQPTIEASGLNMLFTDTVSFVFNVWVNTGTVPSILRISLSNNAAYTKYFYRQLVFSMQRGWNRLVLTKDEFASAGATAITWADTIARVKMVLIQSGNATTGTYIVDHWTVNYTSKPRVILAFINGDTGVFQNAYPIMSTNSQKGNYFILTGLVGSGTYANTSQLTTLKNAGWDIANGSVNKATSITGYNATDMDTEVNDSYDWLVTNGFVTAGAKSFFWYPGSGTSDTLVDVVAVNHKMATTQATFTYQAHQETTSLSQYAYGILWMGNALNTPVYQTIIDTFTSQRQGLLILATARVVADKDSTSTRVSTSQFQWISDYLKTKETAGLLKVETFTEYYNECWNIPSGASPPVYVGDGKKKRMKFYY